MNIPTVDEVLDALYDVIDPELGINIVDLGLVYETKVSEDSVVSLSITLTSPACPLQDVIESQIQEVLVALCERVYFNWVWSPAWNQSMITYDGRDQLRAIGYNSF